MRLFKSKTSSNNDILDSILQSTVSVYLYMAKSANLSGSEINVIDRILRSMFGNEIPLYKIEKARQQILSIRAAAVKLNSHLSYNDKLKLILNLVALAYHERNKIQVLGSVEIVELVDLLRVDVNYLYAIYDLFEGKADSIALKYYDTSATQHDHIHNSMTWGSSNCDFLLAYISQTKLTFIMIESCVLLSINNDCEPESIFLTKGNSQAKKVLFPEKFYLIDNQTKLHMKAGNQELEYGTKDLWTLYSIYLNKSYNQILKTDKSKYKLVYQESSFRLIPEPGAKKLKKTVYALDDVLEVNDVSISATILRHDDQTSSQIADADRFLHSKDNRLRISSKSDSDVLLRFFIENEQWIIENINDSKVYLNRQLLRDRAIFNINKDTISVFNENYIVNRNWELVEIPLDINELVVGEISHKFQKEGVVALDSISFSLQKGNMMAIMGPSGSGKTTLLKVLLGEIVPDHSNIRIDDLEFFANYTFFQQFIGYVPQDDLLFANLTVFENLYYNLRLRLPKIHDKEEIQSRIENLLRSVGLYEQRDMIVGDVMRKKLSGGQRRRLNIALELISNPMVIILDEPTSGLSSKDSESIIHFLSELREQGKIVLCTIHQPNATIFRMFDKILLMDKGGCQVFFGDVGEVFEYFDTELMASETHYNDLVTKKLLNMPEYFYDLIELGNKQSQRIFPPSYWKQRFRDHSFRKAIKVEEKTHSEPEKDESIDKTKSPKQSTHNHLLLLIKRNFVNKCRSKINLVMTLAVAPLLGLFTSLILRSVPESSEYTFYENGNFMLFAFISVIIFIFIGLANSVDDILSEKRIILREKKMNISMWDQLQSKYFVLFCMTVVQGLLYYIITSYILGLKGSFVPVTGFLILAGVIGYQLGLLSSASIHDRSAIINVLPLIIIPQIMFSGAVIKFADMNPALKINKNT